MIRGDVSGGRRKDVSKIVEKEVGMQVVVRRGEIEARWLGRRMEI